MAIARQAFRGLAILFMVAVVVQFFLAGLGLSALGGESMDPHITLGRILEGLAILLLIAAIVGKLGRIAIGLSVALLVLTGLQSAWVGIDDPRWLRALHVLGGVAILLIAHALIRRSLQKPATVEA